MPTTASFIVGAAANAPTITEFARVWVWAAVAVWLITFAAMLRRGTQLVRGEPPAPPNAD